MAQAYKEKIKKVREEAQAPYKNRIMAFRLKRLISETPKSKAEQTFQEKKKGKEEEKIFSEGLEAIASIGESTYAVSTRKRFDEWATHKGLNHDYFEIDRKAWNKGEPIERNGKLFIPDKEFRASGYGAWHINSRIDEDREAGRNVLIVDSPRNRRFLFKEATKEEFEKRKTE